MTRSPATRTIAGTWTDPATPRRFWHVAVISSSVLALELAFIREIPAEVRAISYFTNLIFMASFFGLGIGCLLERARGLAWLLPLGLCAVAGFVYFTRGLVVFEQAEAVHYWLEHDKPLGVARDVPLFVAAFLAFLSCALPFVALGQRLARAMTVHPRLLAYGWDIAGSLAGTLVFVAASALSVPPYVWPLALMSIWSVLLLRRWPSRMLHVGAGAVFVLFAHSPYPAHWSPYYFIQHRVEPRGLRVWVNSSFHQFAANLDFWLAPGCAASRPTACSRWLPRRPCRRLMIGRFCTSSGPPSRPCICSLWRRCWV